MPDPVDAFLDAPPPADQRITELHAWIATNPDGSEGIIAAIVPGLGTTPLVSSKLATATSMRPLAARAVAAAPPQSRPTSIRLATYRLLGTAEAE